MAVTKGGDCATRDGQIQELNDSKAIKTPKPKRRISHLEVFLRLACLPCNRFVAWMA